MRFSGPRFKGGALDVDALAEIAAYKNAIVAVAHLSGQRLKHELHLALVGEITQGSACVHLARSVQPSLLGDEDPYLRAKMVLDHALNAAHAQQSLAHEDLGVLAAAKNLGTFLSHDDQLSIEGTKNSSSVRVTRKSNDYLSKEFDKRRTTSGVNLVGQVYSVDANSHHFGLSTPLYGRVNASFGKSWSTESKNAAISQLAEAIVTNNYVSVTGTFTDRGPRSRKATVVLEEKNIDTLWSPDPDFEKKIGHWWRHPKVDRKLVQQSLPYIRELVWGRKVPPPIVFLSNHNGLSLEWSMPGHWEISVDFDRDTIFGDATNLENGDDDDDFEIKWDEADTLVSLVARLFRRVKW